MKRKNIFIVGCLLFILLISSISLAAPTEYKTITTVPPSYAGQPGGLTDEGEFFLNNLSKNLINPAQLLDILNDKSAKKPLIIDVRANSDYINDHIPGAVWVAHAADMGSQEIGQKIRRLLNEHVASGGENEIVVYCYTGHSAGLVAGVLGERGFNIKNLRFGFNGWVGSQGSPAVIMGPIEKFPGDRDPVGVYGVVSPFGQPIVPMINMAPRLDTLEGKTIAVVGHSFMANVTHTEIKNIILEKYPTATVYLQNEIGSAGKYPAPGTASESVKAFQSKLREMNVDAVITGNGG